MVPLVLWSIVAAVMFGVTWQLQAESAERLLPIKASHILLTLRCTSQEAALRLVLDSINLNRGSPWVCGDLLAEDKDSTPVTEDLAACDVEQESRCAPRAFIWLRMLL